MCLDLLLATVCAFGAPGQGAARFDPAITRADLEACVRFLASDELKGRQTGTQEAVRAAEYLAAGLRRAGLKPAGDGGTCLQRMPMVRTRYESVPALRTWGAQGSEAAWVCDVDFDSLSGVPASARLRVRVVTKPEDVPQEPDPSLALFLDGSFSERRAWLGESRGAGFGLVIQRGSERPGAKPAERPPRGRDEFSETAPPAAPSVSARGPLRERLHKGEIAEIQLDVKGAREELPAFNVIGRIDGHGEKAGQAVVFSAHYDHIGERQPMSPGGGSTALDTVNNGADDDASGCAALLELAEAFAAAEPPARTLLFLFATGEEIGLRGTEYYLDHPVVPLDATVCNLNFEMIGRPDPLAGGSGKLWLTGFERSNLGPRFAELGLPVVVDPRPEQNFFQRSDNFAFAVRGVVAQTLSSYNLHEDYHRVTDEADTLDYAHMEACVRAAFEGAKALAEGRIDPAWNEGGSPRR